jgi:uncharacterized membrane protein
MKKITLVIVLVVGLLVPASAIGKSNDADRRAAKAECKTERGKSSATREAFRALHGSMSRCVKRTTREEAAERKEARTNAAQECKEERALDREAFNEEHGTNANKNNAFGKCVSKKAKAKKAEMDEEDAEEAAERKSAAKKCAAERDEMGRDAFADEWGTNENKSNAFGKCVSETARES